MEQLASSLVSHCITYLLPHPASVPGIQTVDVTLKLNVFCDEVSVDAQDDKL